LSFTWKDIDSATLNIGDAVVVVNEFKDKDDGTVFPVGTRLTIRELYPANDHVQVWWKNKERIIPTNEVQKVDGLKSV
jgi:uncharacterized Zn ribbon protein